MNNVLFQYGRVLKRCTSDINLKVFSRQLSGWIIRQLDARDLGVLACGTCLLDQIGLRLMGQNRVFGLSKPAYSELVWRGHQWNDSPRSDKVIDLAAASPRGWLGNLSRLALSSV